MAAEILIDARSNSGSAAVMTAVEAGELWGIDMGSTSKVSEYAAYVRIECTETRAMSLLEVVPTEDVDFLVLNVNLLSFSSADAYSKLWYLRGKIV